VVTVELIHDYFINWYINEKTNIIKTDYNIQNLQINRFQYPYEGVMGLVHIPHNIKIALCLQYKQNIVTIPLQQCLQ